MSCLDLSVLSWLLWLLWLWFFLPDLLGITDAETQPPLSSS